MDELSADELSALDPSGDLAGYGCQMKPMRCNDRAWAVVKKRPDSREYQLHQHNRRWWLRAELIEAYTREKRAYGTCGGKKCLPWGRW